MRLLLLACLAGPALLSPNDAFAVEWQLQKIATPARVMAVAAADGEVRVNAGGLLYRLSLDGEHAALTFIDKASEPERPEGALPDGRVAFGKRDIARAWLSDPTRRYDHGVLGDKIEAGSLTIEARDSKHHVVKLKDDAVFEDLAPRLADLDGDGQDEVLVVKSSLLRGSSLAVVAAHRGRYEIVAETPPIGSPHRWLNPAGLADFDGDGKVDVAVVRMPHALGQLELWSFADRKARKIAELPDASNHVAGSRAIGMSAVADFDGNGIADLAVPSFDRVRLRLIGFAPQAHEIAAIPLPAKATTDFALITTRDGPPVIALGLEDGSLVIARRLP